MAQQNIIIGAQDAKTGDTLFDAFTKVQANTTELYNDNLIKDIRLQKVEGVLPAAPIGGMFVSDGAGGGEFIRVQGWQQVADSRNTVGVPAQTIATGVRTQFANNAILTNIQKLPSDAITPFWDIATNTIQPIAAFDTYNLRVDFKAQNYTGADPYITCELDIAGTQGVIVSQTFPLVKGGAEQKILFSFPVFAGDTFLANGGKIFLTYTGTGSCTIFGNATVIIRESKNYV